MPKINRIKTEILRDHEANNYKDGRFELADKYDVEDYSEWKDAVYELNADCNFKYIVYIERQEAAVKISYSRYGRKFEESKQPSEIVSELERLIDHVKRLESTKDIANASSASEWRGGLSLNIEGIGGGVLEVEITNTFKMDSEGVD